MELRVTFRFSFYKEEEKPEDFKGVDSTKPADIISVGIVPHTDPQLFVVIYDAEWMIPLAILLEKRGIEYFDGEHIKEGFEAHRINEWLYKWVSMCNIQVINSYIHEEQLSCRSSLFCLYLLFGTSKVSAIV